MRPTMIYLIGQPGSGKSTLMAKLTAPFRRYPCEVPIPHDMLAVPVTGSVIGAEIGRRRGAFSGTDALASAIIDKAEPWVLEQPLPLLLAEGARLANKRFIDAAVAGGYHVTLALLDHDDCETWRELRSTSLRRTQNDAWVRGRRTASLNLAAYYGHPKRPVTVISGHPDALIDRLNAVIVDALNIEDSAVV